MQFFLFIDRACEAGEDEDEMLISSTLGIKTCSKADLNI